MAKEERCVLQIALLEIIADLHAGRHMDQVTQDFVQEIAEGLGMDALPRVSIDQIDQVMLPIIFIRSGGTEGLFKAMFEQLSEPYLLLASGLHNSLAASLEILTFLKQQGKQAEILHGETGYIVERVQMWAKLQRVRRELAETRLGVIGQPSDWLIASDVDYQAAKDRLGVAILDIPMAELQAEIEQGKQVPAEELESIVNRGVHQQTAEGALRIYHALQVLVERYQLNGLTVRCFDLLGAYQNTGCLGMAMLNDAGIVAGCEGDVASLLSMVVLSKLAGEPVFMSNPSRVDMQKNEVVVAHCTVPLTMTKSYTFDTHFESGLGVGVRGVIREGRGTIFKLSGDLSSFFTSGLSIEQNLCEENLCRTQLRLKLDESVEYFLRDPIGNHHIICRGDISQLVNQFFDME